MNWFQQHLNWAFFIAWLVGIGLCLSSLVGIGLYLSSIPSMIGSEGPELFIMFYSISISIIWLLLVLLVGGWFLKQKGRSLWYLVMLPFLREIGVIVFLLLENKRTLVGAKGFRLSDIYTSVDTDKVIHTDYDFRYLQEVLSCPTCVFADQKSRHQGKPWCNAPQAPDIQGNYCHTWQKLEK